jgi:hypothetical protein
VEHDEHARGKDKEEALDHGLRPGANDAAWQRTKLELWQQSKQLPHFFHVRLTLDVATNQTQG